MSSIGLRPSAYFGLRNGIQGNAFYITDDEIIYPVGCVLSIYSLTQHHQRFIRLQERHKTVTLITISPNRKLVGVVEKGDKASISIYDLTTLKRKKALCLPFESAAQEFATISFTYDSKFLIGVLGAPDWTMLCYNWEKGKVDSSTKATIPGCPGPVTKVACNPTDSSVVCVVGPGLFRLMNVTETVWRQYGFQKADVIPIQSVCWLSYDRVLAGTTDGRLLLVETGELKAVLAAMEVNYINAKAKDETATASNTALTEDSNIDIEVRDIICFAKGFAYTCGPGMVHLFEKESNYTYIRRNILKIPDITFPEKFFNLNLVKHLSVNVSGNRLLATTDWTQIYDVVLWGPDSRQKTEILFSNVGEELHHGPVTGLATCMWKPIFITCGEMDRTVRVWNYNTERQELVKQYQEDVFSVALHPTGLYAAIGFSDKLRFMTLMIDDIRPIREFPIRTCRECVFSKNGHLMAAANGNIIQVYSCITFENAFNLTGHNGKITNLIWACMDNKLFSCGSDGAVYEWDIPTMKRIGEIICKDTYFTGVAATTKDGKMVLSISSDGHIREICNSSVNYDQQIMDSSLDCISMANNSLSLYVSTGTGSVLSLVYPFGEKTEFQEFTIHSEAITRMSLSSNEQMLITSSLDGSICLWKMISKERKARMLAMDHLYSNDILIDKDLLDNRLTLINDLRQRMHEMLAEHEYKARQREIQYEEQLQDTQNKYRAIIDELRDNMEQMDMQHTTDVSNLNDEIANMKASHSDATQALESSYDKKLIEEYEKYESFQDKNIRMKLQYEQQLTDLEESKEISLKKLKENYEKQLKERNKKLTELMEESQQHLRDHEEIKAQIEDDADREIVSLKTTYEQALKEEQETSTKLRREIGVVKNKHKAAVKDIEEYKHQILTMTGEQQKFQQIVTALDRDISDLKTEIAERDTSIEDKEKKIYDLNRANQELEKYKFVLSYKIEELKNQIQPKDNELKDKKEQIIDMEKELENLQKTNTTLELQLTELKEKLQSKEVELESAQSQNKRSRGLLRRIRNDIHNASGLIQEPRKLGSAISEMYHKYGQDQEFLKVHVQDIDAQMEFMRQREHLERTVASLKRQVLKNVSGSQGTSIKILDENVNLIAEINALRKELKTAQHHISNMEAVLGISCRYMTPKKARHQLQMAIKGNEEIQNEYKRKLEDREAMIALLKEEIQVLLNKTPTDEEGMSTAVSSGHQTVKEKMFKFKL